MSATSTPTPIIGTTHTDVNTGSLRVQLDTSVQGAQVYSDDKEVTAESLELDSHVLLVDWDGPDDPDNPKKCVHVDSSFILCSHISYECSWTSRRKWTTTVVVSLFTFIAPVASTIIAPASAQVAQEFGITSGAITALITSIFVIGYGKLA